MKEIRLINSKVLDFFVFVILVLALAFFSGFRLESGTDYVNYVFLYQYLGDGYKHWSGIEPGFQALVVLLYGISADPRLFFIVFSFLTIFLFAVAFIRYSPSLVFSLFVFFMLYHYFHSFNLVRQYLAVSIVFAFGVGFLLSRSFFRYAIVVFIASLFHLSSLVMLPFYFFLIREWSGRAYVLFVFGFMLSFFAYPYIQEMIFFILGGYQGYSEYKRGSAGVYLIVVFVLFLIPLLFKKSIFSFGRLGVVSFNAVFVSFAFLILSYHNIMFYRISIYFTVFLSLLIPICLALMPRNIAKYIAVISLTIVLAFNLGFHLYHNVADVIPLRFAL